MVIIPPIFTSEGKTKCSHLYISLAELAANSKLYIVVYLVMIKSGNRRFLLVG